MNKTNHNPAKRRPRQRRNYYKLRNDLEKALSDQRHTRNVVRIMIELMKRYWPVGY
jgi:hypothetical protein